MTSSTLPDNILQEIASAGGNISRVARAMGFDYYALKARAAPVSRTTATVVAPEPADFRDLAKPSLRAFAVAAKREGTDWPIKHKAAIVRARAAYDAGTHEMCQGHRQGWVVLYLIPRLIRTRPRPYFSTMEKW